MGVTEKTKRVRHEQDSVLPGWRWGSTLELNKYIPSNGAGAGGGALNMDRNYV